ncbi:hypothetical protein [Stenotrophomonas virus Jojan60]|nr:hypothetical protein [Stenotrophomonas virus Jojan60]
MCDDCTDRAWERYYNLLDQIIVVVNDWEEGGSGAFGMARLREILHAEEAK